MTLPANLPKYAEEIEAKILAGLSFDKRDLAKIAEMQSWYIDHLNNLLDMPLPAIQESNVDKLADGIMRRWE